MKDSEEILRLGLAGCIRVHQGNEMGEGTREEDTRGRNYMYKGLACLGKCEVCYVELRVRVGG